MAKKRNSVRGNNPFKYDDAHVVLDSATGKYIEQPGNRIIPPDELAEFYKKNTYTVPIAGGGNAEYLAGRPKFGRIIGTTFVAASLLAGAYHATHQPLETPCLFNKPQIMEEHVDPGIYNPPAEATTTPDAVPAPTVRNPGKYSQPSGQQSGAGTYKPAENSTETLDPGFYIPPAGTTTESTTTSDPGYYISPSGNQRYIPDEGAESTSEESTLDTEGSSGAGTYNAPASQSNSTGTYNSGNSTGADTYDAEDSTEFDAGVYVAPQSTSSSLYNGARNLAFAGDKGKKLTTTNITYSASALASMGMKQKPNEYYTAQGTYKNRDERRDEKYGRTTSVGGYRFDENGNVML